MGELDYAKLVPVALRDGDGLTAETLHLLQQKLLERIYGHTHTGNDQALPQGATIRRQAIDAEEILGTHIAKNAIHSHHLAEGAVTGRELKAGAVGEKHLANGAVRTQHLVVGAVTTDALGAGAVTREKLAPDLGARLDSLLGGASTHGYCVWLDGKATYPGTSGNWWDWVVAPSVDVVKPSTPLYRLDEKANWQPARTAGLVKARPDARAPVTIGAITGTGGRTARVAAPVMAPANPFVAKAGLLPDLQAAGWRDLAPDLVERKQIKVDIDAEQIKEQTPARGMVSLNPGVGGTAPFHDGAAIDLTGTNVPVTLERWHVAERIAYHLGIDHPQLEAGVLPTGTGSAELIQRIFDVLQYPERVLAGYWTGPTQNVRAVVRVRGTTSLVRVWFAVPYATTHYAVQVTPDLPAGVGAKPLLPQVVYRDKRYVDLTFWNGTAYVDKCAFSLAVIGELGAP